MTSYVLFTRLMRYSMRYWVGFAVAVLAMVITAATETAFPAMMKPLMDNGFQGKNNFELWWVPAAVLGIFIVRGVATFVATYTMQWISNNVLRDLRRALFAKLVTFPASTFDARTSGQLISKLVSEAQIVLLAATNVVTVLVRDTLILIGLIAWLLWLNWKLTLVVFCLMPLLALVTWKFSRRMRGVSRNYLSAISEMTANVEEAISGNRVIKIYGGQEQENRRFEGINKNFRAQALRLAAAHALQSPINQFVAAVGVAVVLTIALMQSKVGVATVGDFVSFITAMLMMFSPLKHLSDVNSQLQQGLAAAEGVFKMLDEHSEFDNGKIELQRVKGDIVFDNVKLIYPSRDVPALASVSLHVPAGKTYAFVGTSGGGKSSLVNLIPRLYEVTDGAIYIDGIDIRTVTLNSLRTQVSLVSQDVVLFNDTIKGNIVYGRDDVSIEEINRAVIAADLESFVRILPEGLETVVGDRGVRLSGGQRQRIAIARAIIKNAPILILDEATSALDNVTESSVQQAIEALRKGRTTLVVAHRLSTVRSADQIVVMSDGHIVQQGTHDQLLEEPGVYRSLYSTLSKIENEGSINQ